MGFFTPEQYTLNQKTIFNPKILNSIDLSGILK
jgi:hypothetical protein